MLLAELSIGYEKSAELLRRRRAELRALARETADPEQARRYRRRMAELDPLLREMRELAALTARYYERGYYRSGKYTL